MDNQNTAPGNPFDNQYIGAGGPPLPPSTTPPSPLPEVAPSPMGAPTFSPIGGIPTPPTESEELSRDDQDDDEPILVAKKRLAPAIMAALALFLVAAVAGASYYISTQLSSRVAVAPTAPESEPMASSCSGWQNAIDCDKQLVPDCAWYGCGCALAGTDPKIVCPDPTVTTTPSPTTTPTAAPPASTCPTGEKYEDDVWGWHPVACGQGCPAGQGKKSRCNWSNPDGYSCVIAGSNDYLNECRDADGEQHWEYGACEASATCNTCVPTLRDTPASNSITFSRAGTVKYFTRNIAGTITLTGPKTVTLNPTAGNAVQQTQTFTVAAGETYTMTVKLSSEAANSAGWITNKSTNICGPTKSALCGVDVDIAAVRTLAASNSDMTGITAAGAAANIQCWADMIKNDTTQDYDYNDFTIIFGYTSGTRPEICGSSSVAPATVPLGTSMVLTATTNGAQINEVWWQLYNMDNLYGPDNPKPICWGNEPRKLACDQLDPYGNPNCPCPQGGENLIFSDPNKTLRTTGTMTLPYKSIFLADKSYGGKQVTHARVSAFFSTTGGPGSLANGNCMKVVSAVTPTLTAVGQCSASDSSVKLTWPAITNANDYYLYRCEGATCTPTVQLGSPQTGLTYTHTPVSPGNTYGYRIRGHKTSDDTYTEYSAIVRATGPVNCTTPPPAIPTLTVAPQCVSGVSKMVLSWIASPGANDYYLYRCEGATCTPTVQLGSPQTGLTYTHTPVSPGNTYGYRIRAHRTSDDAYSGYSGTVRKTALACPTVTPPPGGPVCVAVRVAALKNGVWTILSPSEYATMVKLGDTIRLIGTGNPTTTRMRFKATNPNGQPVFTPEWKEGIKGDSTGGASAGIFYVELSITISGSYSFEAQVL